MRLSKKGEVFGKDIVQRRDKEDKLIVEWDNYLARYYLKNLNEKSVIRTQEISLVRVCKILGNSTDNLDLLK